MVEVWVDGLEVQEEGLFAAVEREWYVAASIVSVTMGRREAMTAKRSDLRRGQLAQAGVWGASEVGSLEGRKGKVAPVWTEGESQTPIQ